MDNQSLDRALAESMGWTVVDHEMFTPDPCELWLDLKTGYPVCKVADFSPSTDSNHLRLYVLPEIVKRDLWEPFESASFHLSGGWSGSMLLNASPAVLARAALEVLTAHPENL